MRRRRQERTHEASDEPDDVIDLTARLAPYAEAALRPKGLERPPDGEAASSEPLWDPLEFDFPYRTGGPSDA